MSDQPQNAQRPMTTQEFLTKMRSQRVSRDAMSGKPQQNPAQGANKATSSASKAQESPAPKANTEKDQNKNMSQDSNTPQPESQQEEAQFQQTPDANIPDNIDPEKSRVAPGMYRPIPEQDIIEWKAPSRPFKKHNKQFFTYVSVIAALVSLILFFAGQFLPIAVVISAVFLVYVLSVVPPHDVLYKVTTYGIRIEGILYYWEEMGRFWLSEKYKQHMVKIEIGRFPGRLTLMLGEVDPDLIKELFSEVLLHKRPKRTLYENAAKWLQEKVPLE